MSARRLTAGSVLCCACPVWPLSLLTGVYWENETRSPLWQSPGTHAVHGRIALTFFVTLSTPMRVRISALAATAPVSLNRHLLLQGRSLEKQSCVCWVFLQREWRERKPLTHSHPQRQTRVSACSDMCCGDRELLVNPIMQPWALGQERVKSAWQPRAVRSQEAAAYVLT